MARSRDLLLAWPRTPTPGVDEEAQFSIQTHEPVGIEAMTEAVTAAAGDQRVGLAAAFPLEFARTGLAEFWILSFPDLRVQDAEQRAFEVARSLLADLNARSVRPVLVDSLVGAAVAARATDMALFEASRICETNDIGPTPRGWAPFALGVRTAWLETRGRGATIASIDTGLSTHQELRGVSDATQPHVNLVEGGTDASDPFSNALPTYNPGHGTLVASVAASRGDIDERGETGGPTQVTGTAPEADILPIRALRSVVNIRQSRLPAAIEHAIAREVDVIVLAVGSPFAIEPVEVALRRAAAAGIVTVCAAGNCYGPVIFPAKLATQGLTTAVAAVDHRLQPWEKTAKGPAVTVSAFGEAVWGARKEAATDPDDSVARSEGTTLAAALTAGVAALWVAHHGRATLRRIASAQGTTVQRIFNTALRGSTEPSPGWPPGMGAGLVNAARLLSFDLETLSITPDVPTPLATVTPLSRLLPTAVAETDQLAGLESARLSEEYAAEALWSFYVRSATDRAYAAGLSPRPLGTSSADRRPTQTQGFKDALAPLTRLHKLLG